MSESAIIDRILAIARQESAERLLETSAATLHADLYEEAVDAFGGWDAALAEALAVAVREQAPSTGRSASRQPADEEEVERVVTEAASHPLFALTSAGAFYTVPAADVPMSDAPIIPGTPHGAGRIRQLVHLGEPSGVVVFTDRGHYFGIDARMVPRWEGDMLDRRVQDVIHLEEGERIVDVLPRAGLHADRVIHVTRQAKAKASATADYHYTLDRQARQAFLLNDEDAPVAVLAGPAKNGVFCASAMGKAIHFDASDLRSMGLAAVGVNAMKLADDSDEVVGAFLAHGVKGKRVEQVAIITEQGLGKRVDFDEFRPQGRAGAGLQLLRLDRGDRVASAVACRAGEDLAIATDRGRLLRLPATAFPRMGRPAKGDRQIELVDDERVVALSALPCAEL